MLASMIASDRASPFGRAINSPEARNTIRKGERKPIRLEPMKVTARGIKKRTSKPDLLPPETKGLMKRAIALRARTITYTIAKESGAVNKLNTIVVSDLRNTNTPSSQVPDVCAARAHGYFVGSLCVCGAEQEPFGGVLLEVENSVGGTGSG